MSRNPYLSFFFVLLLFAIAPTPTSADCRAKAVHPSNDEIQLVVPFAVPVGVPVAPFAPYFYSYRLDQSPAVANQQVAQPSRPAVLDNQTGRKTDSHPAPETAPQVAKTTSLVATYCASCHGDEHPKAELSLEQLESLSAVDRLRAIDAVITGRMPKSHRLSPAQVQAIVKELAANHDTENESPAGP